MLGKGASITPEDLAGMAAFCFCNKIPETINLKRRKVCLVYRFGVFKQSVVCGPIEACSRTTHERNVWLRKPFALWHIKTKEGRGLEPKCPL